LTKYKKINKIRDMENKINKKLIGIGRTSEVYEYNNDCVLKLYYSETEEIVKKEYNFAKYVFNKNIRTPEPIEIIKIDNRYGIIFQKVNGKSLLNNIMNNIFIIKKMFSKMAYLHYDINKIDFNDNTYTYKKYLKWAINESKYLSNNEKDKLIGYILKLPEGNKLCHGDFHPENIICDNDKLYIIDWMTGMQGAMAADVARTEMILRNADIPGKTSFFIKILNKIASNLVANIYIKKYCKISGLKLNEINIWKLPLYVARLHENNSKKEEEKLIKKIKKLIKKQTSA